MWGHLQVKGLQWGGWGTGSSLITRPPKHKVAAEEEKIQSNNTLSKFLSVLSHLLVRLNSILFFSRQEEKCNNATLR